LLSALGKIVVKKPDISPNARLLNVWFIPTNRPTKNVSQSTFKKSASTSISRSSRDSKNP